MLIQRINIFLLSFIVGISPAFAVFFIPVVYQAGAVVVTAAAATVLIQQENSTQMVASATYDLNLSPLTAGAVAASLIASASAAYSIKENLNKIFGVNDAVSAALAASGYSVVDGVVKKPPVVDPSTLNPSNVQYVWTAPIDPARYFSSPQSACQDRAAMLGRVYSSIEAGSQPYFFHCKSDTGYQYSNVYQYENPNYSPASNAPVISVTNNELGAAIAASPDALKELRATAAMNEAQKNTKNVENCYAMGGTFSLNTMTCNPAINPVTGQPVIGQPSAEETAARAAAAASRAAATQAKDQAIAASQAYDAALADALANPTDVEKEKALNIAISNLTNANAAATRANTQSIADAAAVTDAATAPATSTTNAGSKAMPVFCTWAIVVCDAIAWAKAEPIPTPKEEVEHTELQSNVMPVNPTINFGGQCPAPINFDFTFYSRSFHHAFQWTNLCNSLVSVKPFVLGISNLMAVFILLNARKEAS